MHTRASETPVVRSDQLLSVMLANTWSCHLDKYTLWLTISTPHSFHVKYRSILNVFLILKYAVSQWVNNQRGYNSEEIFSNYLLKIEVLLTQH